MRTGNVAFPILVFAVTISLFTQLRIAFFGVGEVLILIVFLSYLARPVKRTHLRQFVFSGFWVVYIFLSMLGAAVNTFVLENPTGTFEQMMFDLAAYTFVLIACFTFEKMYFDGLLDLRKFLIALFYFSGSVLAGLYILSFFTSSLFGIPLNDYDHFAPLVNNVHQVSMYLVVLPFVGGQIILSSSGALRLTYAAMLVVAAVSMSFAAATTKADLAIVIGAVFLVYGYTLSLTGRRFSVPINMLYVGLFLAAIYWLDVASLFREFFMEADPHRAREHLYSNSLNVIADSPLFGHGPGPHVLHSGSFWDVHQTHLAILLQAGLIGLVLYLGLLVRVLARIRTSPMLLAAFAAVFTYSAGGDILRRLSIWILLLLIYYWKDPGRGNASVESGSRVGELSIGRP